MAANLQRRYGQFRFVIGRRVVLVGLERLRVVAFEHRRQASRVAEHRLSQDVNQGRMVELVLLFVVMYNRVELLTSDCMEELKGGSHVE